MKKELSLRKDMEGLVSGSVCMSSHSRSHMGNSGSHPGNTWPTKAIKKKKERQVQRQYAEISDKNGNKLSSFKGASEEVTAS